MIKKRTLIAFGLGAAAMWYADPVSGTQRRAQMRASLARVDERIPGLADRLPDDLIADLLREDSSADTATEPSDPTPDAPLNRPPDVSSPLGTPTH